MENQDVCETSAASVADGHPLLDELKGDGQLAFHAQIHVRSSITADKLFCATSHPLSLSLSLSRTLQGSCGD